jgi:hypothetical protein
MFQFNEQKSMAVRVMCSFELELAFCASLSCTWDAVGDPILTPRDPKESFRRALGESC